MEKKSSKKFPKNVESMSKEKLAEVLKVKKECNSRALNIVKDMIEEKVDEETFLKQLQHINQNHFDDIIEERCISKLCGYPLCCKTLEKVSSQTFHISLTNKKVYDIRMRKKFCSDICFSSAMHIKQQMHTSPLWLRDVTKLPKFELLKHGKSLLGDEIHIDVRISNEDILKEQRQSKLSVNKRKDIKASQKDSINEDRKLELRNKNVTNDSHDKDRNVINKEKSSCILTTEDCIKHVEDCVLEWCNMETLIFLIGEDNVKKQLENKSDIENLKTKFNKITVDDKIQNLCRNLNLSKFDEIRSDESKNLTKFSDCKMVKQEAELQYVKTNAFYSGSLEHVVPEFDFEIKENKNENTSLFVMPEVDSQSQNVLRRKILVQRLHIIITDLLNELKIKTIVDVRDIKNIVSYFNLTPSNIVFRPQEWKLLSVLVVKMLCLKNKELSDEFTPARQVLLGKVLFSYGLDLNYLKNFMDKVVNISWLLNKMLS